MTPRERAAALIRELAQQDKISGYVAGVEDDIAAAIEEAVAQEREACARYIELAPDEVEYCGEGDYEHAETDIASTRKTWAAAIRARAALRKARAEP
jgi:hypothetical protein